MTARQLKIVNPLLRTDLPADAADALFTTMLEETQRDFRQAYAARHSDEQTPPRHPFLSKKSLRLTEAQLTEMHAKLVNLIEEVIAVGEENGATDEPLYDLTGVFFKTTRTMSHDPRKHIFD